MPSLSTMVGFRNFIELVKFGQRPNTGVEVEVELLQVSGKVALQDHILFSLFSMTPLGNAKNVVLSRCRLLVNMTFCLKLSYYRGNTKT